MSFLCSCNGLSPSCPVCGGKGFSRPKTSNAKFTKSASNARTSRVRGRRKCPYCEHSSQNKNERLMHVFLTHEDRFVEFSGRSELIRVCETCGFKTIRKKAMSRHKCQPVKSI
jgi:hypothetical protein